MTPPMGGRIPSAGEVARLLRQSVEMGGGDVFLDGRTREQALDQIARALNALHDDGHNGPGGPLASEGPTPDSKGTDRSGTGAPLVLPNAYDDLRKLALACTRCGLASGRTHVVFSDGSPTARLMVVGEAPGANEDASGVPFVGMAGQFLDLLLATVGLSREDSVYIANVLKCRPPGNRDPQPNEIASCSPFLLKQIELVKPDALLAVGSFSARLLTGRDGVALGQLRGAVHRYHDVPLVVTYHPAALLRNRRWIRSFWDDLQLLRSILDAAQVS